MVSMRSFFCKPAKAAGCSATTPPTTGSVDGTATPAAKKMPKKIKYEGYVWEYDKVAKDYYRNNIDGEYIYLFRDLFEKTIYFLNNVVEIIEENKKIEKIKILIDDINTEYVANDKGEKLSYSKSDLIFADRINELIDEVNKLKGEE